MSKKKMAKKVSGAEAQDALVMLLSSNLESASPLIEHRALKENRALIELVKYEAAP